jgi:hypothetical protein
MCIVETYGVLLFSINIPEVEEKTFYYGGYDGAMLDSTIKSEVPIRTERIVNTPCGRISEIFKKYPDHPEYPGDYYHGERNICLKTMTTMHLLSS